MMNINKKSVKLLGYCLPAIALATAGIIWLSSPFSVSAVGEPLTIGANVSFSGSYNLTSQKFIDTGSTSYFLDPNATDTSLVVAGNVGIGTTGPLELLHVSKSTSGGVGARIAIANSATEAVGNAAELVFKNSPDYSAGYYSAAIRSVETNTLSPHASDLAFLTYRDAFNEWMRITSQGNVGIGTTGPGQKLSVVGDISATTNLYVNDARAYSGNMTVGPTGGGSDLYLRANNATLMTLSNNGNVGIGTTSPGAKLHVYENLTGVAAERIVNVHASGYSGLEFMKKDNSTVGTYFGLNSDDTYFRMNLIDKPLGIINGNVGIGTTGPTAPLHITSGSDYQLRLTRTGVRNYDFNVNSVGTFSLGDFGTRDLVITNTGNVGIGTTGPTGKLTVATSDDTTPTTITAFDGRHSVFGTAAAGLALSYSATNAQSYLTSIAPNVAWKGMTFQADNFSFVPNTLGSTALYVKTDGKVGIGTTGPVTGLDLGSAGGVRMRINPGTTATNVAGIFTGFAHHDLLIGSYQDGTLSHGFISTGYGADGGRDFSIGRSSSPTMSSATFTPLLTVNSSSGNVGIGTTAPSQKLEVVGTVKATGFNGQCIADANNPFGNNVTRNCNYDIAETYDSSEDVAPGDVMTMDTNSPSMLKKSTSFYDRALVGIVTTSPGIILGSGNNEVLLGGETGLYSSKPENRRKPAIALAGRVPVNMAPDSEPIHAGDYLTSSNTPGKAMKATHAGPTVGKALEDWTPDSGKTSILVFLNVSWYDPDVYFTATGDLEIKNNSQTPYVYDGNQNIENQISNIKDQNYILKIKNEITDRIGAFGELWTAKITSGLIEAENAIISNTLIAKNAILETVVTKIINSEKITSPVVETTDLIATGSAQLNTIATNEITPQNGDLTIDLSSPNPPNAGALAKLIIKGLEGKSAVVIDAAGNASFSGQIIADSLTINNDATVSGNLDSNTLTTNEATVSGTLTAKEVQAENISNLTKTVFDQRQSLTDQNSSINDIQALLADIKNQPIPDPTNYQNIPSSTTNYELLTTNYLTVTGNSNLYNVSVSNSLLVGTTLIDQNSIISLASELKLSALSTINLFDGAVVIAKDGTITTKGELIAEKGIRTNEIKPLTDDGQVLINNLAINNLTINNISTNSAVIAASDNFDKNGLFAPAIETASASAGIGILPENSQEVVIYNNNIKENSLIYLTPTSSTASISQLAVGEKSTGEKPYFKVITNTPSTLPIKFNWLIIN